MPKLVVDEAEMCVDRLGPNRETRPLTSERLKEAILWPPKAFRPTVEVGLQVGGLRPDGEELDPFIVSLVKK